MKAVIAIIGAGQLGTRHLQSLAGSESAAEIWVIDPSPSASALVQSRLAEIGAVDADVHFSTSLDVVPRNLDVAVIATNSMPRLDVLVNLLEARRVSYLVLEKFLFPRLCDYESATAIIERSGVDAFVNCPRRLFEGYKRIKRSLKGLVSISVSGSDWGLACNSVHFVDLLDFLRPVAGFEVRASLSPAAEAKRVGYVEFFGRINVRTERGDHLEMICEEGGRKEAVIEIHDAAGRNWRIIESRRQVESDTGVEVFPVPFQSRMTAGVVSELLRRGTCELTPFHCSQTLHKALLEEFLRAFNVSRAEAVVDLCPIT